MLGQQWADWQDMTRKANTRKGDSLIEQVEAIVFSLGVRVR
jgi:hypothetical protein